MKYFISNIFVFTVFLAKCLTAQSIHISPAYEPIMNNGLSILEIEVNDASYLDTEISINNNILFINTSGSESLYQPLNNLTLSTLIIQIENQFSGKILATSSYPHYNASLLKNTEGVIKITAVNTPEEFKSKNNEPQTLISFGTLMTLANNTDGNILNNTGFQFDFIMNYQFFDKRDDYEGWQGFITTRLGLSSDEELQTTDDRAGNDLDLNTTSEQFENVLSQANVANLTFQADFIRSINDKFDLIFQPLAGLTFANSEEFVFPSQLIYPDTTLTSSDIFEDRDISRVIGFHNIIRPLGEGGISFILRFNTQDKPLFYFGGGYYRRTLLKRGFQFNRDSQTLEPRSETLRGRINYSANGAFKVITGARLGNMINFRLDTVLPTSEDSDPLFRFVLVGNFPVN